VKIKRTFDAARLNEIINHPSVHPWVCGRTQGYLDMTPLVENRDNVLLTGEHGALLFILLQPGLYEVHSQCLPEGRGEWMLSFVRACLHWMFTRTAAVEIMTHCPKGNLAARALAKAIGGRLEFRNPRGWFKDGETVFTDVFSLKIQDWMREAPGLEERGAWFHDRLEREYARVGFAEPVHDHDATHDRYVGAACEMILGKQVQKGVIFYNRWARMAGYAVCDVASLQPAAINIRDALLIIPENGDFYVAAINPAISH
jgi:hypothetical protein